MGEIRQSRDSKGTLNSLKRSVASVLGGKGDVNSGLYNSQIASKVKAIIVDKLTVDENEVDPGAEFSKDLGADSLDAIELIMEFEKEFGITIPDEDAERITTVGDAVLYIQTHV